MKFSFRLEDIKYIKFSYKNNQGILESAKVAIKEFNEKEILTCAKFKDSLFVEIPQEVNFSVVCNDGIYKTKTILKYVYNDEPYMFFVFEPPSSIEHQQNREFFRVPVKYECVYKAKSEGVIREFDANTFDISANGVSINLPSQIIPEGLSELVISINDKKIISTVRYIRSEKTDNGYRASFAFVSILESDRDYISQVCIKEQLEQRRKNLK